MTSIAITGHTSGIGKACADMFSGCEIFGYSRSNGWNIELPDAIVQDAVANKCTVFINNAYNAMYQSVLLEKLYVHWKDTENTIINIGSYITDYPRLEKELDDKPWNYRDDKKHLLKTFRRIVQEETSCMIHMISPGPVNTPMIAHLPIKDKLHTEQVARIVKHTIDNPYLKEVIAYV